MSKPEYTTVRMRDDRKRRLEMAAIEVGYAKKEPYKWTDILFYLIDEHLDEAVKDLKNKRLKNM